MNVDLNMYDSLFFTYENHGSSTNIEIRIQHPGSGTWTEIADTSGDGQVSYEVPVDGNFTLELEFGGACQNHFSTCLTDATASITVEKRPISQTTELYPLAVFEGAGNVGIGVTTPTEKLQVAGAIHSISGGFIFPDGSVMAGAFELDGQWLSNDGDLEGIKIEDDGKVTIGNGSGTNDLNIISSGGCEINLQNGVGGQTWQLVSGFSSGFEIGNVTDGAVDSNAPFYIDPSGNVGIGTTNPQAALEIGGSVLVGNNIQLNGNWLSNDGGNEGIHIDDGGRVGIRTDEIQTNFAATIKNANKNGLVIAAGENTFPLSNKKMIEFQTPAGIVMGSIEQTSINAVSYNTTSDERLKTGINPTKYGLSDLMNIKVVDYYYKTDQANLQTGFLAQQLNEHYSPAVSEGGDNPITDPWTVEYGDLTPLLVKAVQEQQQLIENLKLKIENLEAEVEASR